MHCLPLTSLFTATTLTARFLIWWTRIDLHHRYFLQFIHCRFLSSFYNFHRHACSNPEPLPSCNPEWPIPPKSVPGSKLQKLDYDRPGLFLLPPWDWITSDGKNDDKDANDKMTWLEGMTLEDLLAWRCISSGRLPGAEAWLEWGVYLTGERTPVNQEFEGGIIRWMDWVEID